MENQSNVFRFIFFGACFLLSFIIVPQLNEIKNISHNFIIVYDILIMLFGFYFIVSYRKFLMIDLVGFILAGAALTLSFYINLSDVQGPLLVCISVIYLVFLACLNFISIFYKKYRKKVNEDVNEKFYQPLIQEILDLDVVSNELSRKVQEMEANKARVANIYESTKNLNKKLDLNEIFETLKDIFRQWIGIDNLMISMDPCYGKSTGAVVRLFSNMEGAMQKYLDLLEEKIVSLFMFSNLSSYTLKINEDPDFAGDNTGLDSFVIIPLIVRKERIGFIGFFIRKKEVLTDEMLNLAVITSRNLCLGLNKVILYRKLKDLSEIDGLTKLALRRVLLSRLESDYNRAKSENRPLYLIMIDIDFFKRFNDQYGHLIGDEVLRKVGAKIQENLSSNMLGARYGGEEFAVIIPENSDVISLAHQIKDSIQGERIVIPETGEELGVTISMGVAPLEKDVMSPLVLIKRADDALYQAKRTGRDRIVYYPDRELAPSS